MMWKSLQVEYLEQRSWASVPFSLELDRAFPGYFVPIQASRFRRRREAEEKSAMMLGRADLHGTPSETFVKDENHLASTVPDRRRRSQCRRLLEEAGLG